MTDRDDTTKPELTKSLELDIDLAGAKQLVPVSISKEDGKLESLAQISKQIARMREPRLIANEMLDSLKIIYPEMPDKKVLNSYRELRTKLFQFNKTGNFVVMVSSIVPFAESSNITINIGSAFAFDSTKTALLVDCNLSAPKLNKLFNIDTEVGLTSFLEDDKISIDKIIFPTGVHRLRLIPVGHRREMSTEYFSSIRMRHFLQAVKKRYPDRFILIDSPSIGESADAKIIADLCDFIVLIVPYASVTEAKLLNTIDSIDKSKIAGIVFN
ncbi:MAG: polysaccharide biosynthesis protein [Gammaproteobacteria bacterium]|nr:polysaccharide biosynthesis protein [Gammaproteobacteria bacterium]